jgi:hypothetical protein
MMTIQPSNNFIIIIITATIIVKIFGSKRKVCFCTYWLITIVPWSFDVHSVVLLLSA